jgi:hypothetical protein
MVVVVREALIKKERERSEQKFEDVSHVSRKNWN